MYCVAFLFRSSKVRVKVMVSKAVALFAEQFATKFVVLDMSYASQLMSRVTLNGSSVAHCSDHGSFRVRFILCVAIRFIDYSPYSSSPADSYLHRFYFFYLIFRPDSYPATYASLRWRFFYSICLGKSIRTF